MQQHITIGTAAEAAPAAAAVGVGRACAHTYARPRQAQDGFGVHIVVTSPPVRGQVTERWTWHSDPAAPSMWSLDHADRLLTALGWRRIDAWMSSTARAVPLSWTCTIEL